MSTEQSNFNAGSTATLVCSTNALTSQPARWQWYHNSQPVSSDTDRHLIFNLSRAHMGMYQCCYLTSSSDSNTCCAQTQLRVSSKSCFSPRSDSFGKQKMFISTSTRPPAPGSDCLSTHAHLAERSSKQTLSIYLDSPPFILTAQQTHSNIVVIPSNRISHVPIDLNLTIYADPPPTIGLFKDGQPLVSDIHVENLPSEDILTHYRIHASELQDTGLYEYRINNSHGVIAFSKHVNLEKQLPYIQPIANQTIVTGTYFTLACYASGQPDLRLQWIDNNNQQVLNSSTTSPLLLTATTIQSHAYTCRASNPFGESYLSVHVAIQVPAKILSFSANRTMKVNDTLNVSCVAEGDRPLEVKLQTPQSRGIRMDGTETEHRKSVAFTIERVRMSDKGLYQCHARNLHSEARSTFELIVQNVPDRIDTIFVENAHRISWSPPFDGNAKIFKYILRIRYKQGTPFTFQSVLRSSSV